MKRRSRVGLIFLGLIALLSGLTVWSLYRERRQERLNRALIAAVKDAVTENPTTKHHDTIDVISLLNQGADPNCRDEPYRPVPWWQMLRDRLRGVKPEPSTALTPLLLALFDQPHGIMVIDGQRGVENPAIVCALFSHGARADVEDESGNTPLSLALHNLSGFSGIKGVSFLDAHGIVHIGRGSLSSNEAVMLLIASHVGLRHSTHSCERAPLVIVTMSWVGPDVIAAMLRYGADIDEKDYQGQTALISACEEGLDVDTVKFLLANHADVMIRESKGRTALQLAEQAEKQNPTPNCRQIIDMLKQAGAKK